jgi:hypothetical protein
MPDTNQFSDFVPTREAIRAELARTQNRLRSACIRSDQVLMYLHLIHKWLNLLEGRTSELADRIHQEHLRHTLGRDRDASRSIPA